MLAADIAAQRLVPDRALPVGVMTGAFGGLYLAWLLTMEWRKGRHEPAPLRAEAVTLAYDGTSSPRLSVDIPDGGFTAIVGPNACGKSTLLRALVRMLKPRAGHACCSTARRSRRCRPSRSRAGSGCCRRPRSRPTGSRSPTSSRAGAIPHQRLLRQWSREDERAVREAMAQTHVEPLADRLVDELSGGQRQRVWIAMALAQETPLLLLDEPTTFLDIAHQVEVLDLCAKLHVEGRTLVAVLHDLNHACRYATHLIAMRDGAIVAEGPPAEIVDAELVEAVFGLQCLVVPCPATGAPMVVPAA